jgi:2-phosphosulfolactate phosphatase
VPKLAVVLEFCTKNSNPHPQMPPTLEVFFTPAEFATLPQRDLTGTVCVVFDILRATSTIVTALANGATAVIPVAEIPEALALKRARPELLLGGEREGVRIRANLTGGVEFDLGNSPREFTRERVQGRTIVLTTTNGSRALRACAAAREVLASSFLNLRATAEHLQALPPSNLLLVCSGTFDQAAFEDMLGAGALADLLWDGFARSATDSTRMAREIYLQHRHDLMRAMEHSRNGRRLLANPDLYEDVAWCLQHDTFPLVAKLQRDAIVRLDQP